MTAPTLRERVRDLIAEKIHAAECGCDDYRPDGSDADDPYYRHTADAVMELFPEVDVEEVVPFRGAAVHTCYALRTVPEPIEEDR